MLVLIEVIKFNTGFLLKALFITSLISVVVGGLHSDLFKIKSTVIEESAESSGPEVFDSLQSHAKEIAEKYHDQNIWWVDVSDIAQKIRALPGVKDVVVERQPPHQIKIILLPEPIRLVYVTRQGQLYPITESATVLKNFRSKIYPDVPITLDEKVIKNSKIRAQAVDLVSSLPPSGLLSRTSVAELKIASEKNKNSNEQVDFWLTLIQPDVKVKINSKNAAVKAERVERVLDYTRKHNLHARVIDSEYSKKVVVKLRKDR